MYKTIARKGMNHEFCYLIQNASFVGHYHLPSNCNHFYNSPVLLNTCPKSQTSQCNETNITLPRIIILVSKDLIFVVVYDYRSVSKPAEGLQKK